MRVPTCRHCHFILSASSDYECANCASLIVGKKKLTKVKSTTFKSFLESLLPKKDNHIESNRKAKVANLNDIKTKEKIVTKGNFSIIIEENLNL